MTTASQTSTRDAPVESVVLTVAHCGLTSVVMPVAGTGAVGDASGDPDSRWARITKASARIRTAAVISGFACSEPDIASYRAVYRTSGDFSIVPQWYEPLFDQSIRDQAERKLCLLDVDVDRELRQLVVRLTSTA